MKLVVVHILTMIVQPPLAKLRTYMLREPIIKVGITTRSGNAYQGPTIPTTSFPPKVVEREMRTPCPIKGGLRVIVKDPHLGTSSGIRAWLEALIYRRISFNPHPFSRQILKEMEHSNNTPAKILILDTRKFEQWKFRIQRYLQHEHYALWEVIKFGDSYVVPINDTAIVSASEGTATKKGRTVALTTEDMQKRRNDTAQELWAAILKTFGANEATKKTKKNLLKQQYGNFKDEGKETLEQTFNILQVIVSQLEFMNVEIE
nr:hypothetical protein [Tanacetum cinerariifolium]